MHHVQYVLLRLFVDPQDPQKLHGGLREMPYGNSRTFSDEEDLLALLRQLVTAQPQGSNETDSAAADPPEEIQVGTH